MSEPTGVREQLAALAHEQWAGWMQWMLARFEIHRYPTGHEEWIVDGQDAQRWWHQMQTPYADLSEQEKDADRAEADRVLALVAAEMLRPMALGWGRAAAQYAAEALAVAMERETCWEGTDDEVVAEERESFLAAIAAFPADVGQNLRDLFERAVRGDDGDADGNRQHP